VKSAALLPVNSTLETVKAVVPVVFRVTVCKAELVPTVCPAKVNETGVTVAVVTVAPAVADGISHTPRP
jgi:hypothetical protein